MNVKRISAVAVALLMIVSLCALPVFASGCSLTIDAPATVKSGADYTVVLKAQTDGNDMAAMYVDLTFDNNLFTFVSATANKAGTKSQVLTDEGTPNVIGLKTATDNSSYNDEAWFTLVFTAATVADTETASFSVAGSGDDPWQNDEYNELDVSLPSAKSVSIVLGPSVSISDVATEAPVGVAINPTVTPSDNELTVSYAWVIDEETVSEEATFTPDASMIGETLTFTATVTDGTDTADDTVSFTVVKNTEYKPEVKFVTVPASAKAGKKANITYSYEDKNGLADAIEKSNVYVNFVSDDEPETTKMDSDPDLPFELSKTEKGGTITVTPVKGSEGKSFVVTIFPVNEDEDEGDSVTSEAIVIKKASSSGYTGGGASLVKTEDKDDTKDTDKDDDNKDDDKVSKALKDASKDDIVLEIGNKDASVFGEIETNDVAPVIRNDRTMLPARFVAEALGAKVDWDDETKTVTITKGDLVIKLVIGADKATVNGEELDLDSPAFIENDRTYTPIRFISEALGAKVDWDDALRAVTITPAE